MDYVASGGRFLLQEDSGRDNDGNDINEIKAGDLEGRDALSLVLIITQPT